MPSIKAVRSELERLRDELTPTYIQKVEDSEAFDPLCVVLWDDGREDFLYLEYDNMQERQEVFAEMNEYLKQDEIVGCVFIIDTEYKGVGEKETLDAVYVTINGFGIKELIAYPFRVKGEEVEWLEQFGPKSVYETNFITAFSERVH